MMLIKTILFLIIISSILYAQESYPDYYNRVIKPTAIYSANKQKPDIKNKYINGEFGFNISFNYLFASKFNDMDSSFGYGISYKKNYSKFDYLQYKLYYNKFEGKMNNVEVENELFLIESKYMFKPPVWSLPIFIGGGIGFVYNRPDIPFQKTDKSGLFITISSAYILSNNTNIFISLSKSTLQQSDFKENISLGLNYYIY